ncbi:BTAD domain-containing putative transcriptional regulator [Streptomyces sp. NPDC051180]|uniref:AfsR/SARP family transcriptional regulator n=1 Tax=Streptomyces sp. NPDC051180 TaxID=3155797 RepID=UPI00344F6FDE
MRFGVLGPLVVWDAEGAPVRVPETKVRTLLAVLLAHEGRPVPVDRLVDDIWGDAVPGNPANALQAKVSQLRRAIGRDRVAHLPAGYRLRLDGGPTEVDAGEFRALAARARLLPGPRARALLLTEALELWRGPAYADFADAEFVRPEAGRLAEERLAVVEEQAEARMEFGDPALLGETASLVADHPLRERLRAVRMRALYAAGRQSEAIAAYTELRTLLADELGLDPSPELAALYAAILRHDPGLTPSPGAGGAAAAGRIPTDPEPDRGIGATDASDPACGPVASARPDAAAPHAFAARPPYLPVPPTVLVGRGPAVEEVGRLAGSERLVTLTGPGGVGKTRLALAVAERVSGDPDGRVPDGVWFVELGGLPGVPPGIPAGSGAAGTPGTADVVQAVAGALGVRDAASSARSAGGPTEVLLAAVRDRRLLLVLDNCEHVIEAAADLVASLLSRAPGVRVLVTSRESLRLPGEYVYAVDPLAPDAAARLFVERAAAAAPGFAPGITGSTEGVDAGSGSGSFGAYEHGNDRGDAYGRGDVAGDAYGNGGADGSEQDAVADICRRLDCLPLALELAATRVRALGVRELAARLGDRFRLLASGQRGLPARQQTLRAVIDWSWDLLDPSERAVLRRMSVSAGGCAPEAAEAVCAGDGIAREDVLDLVGRLVDRSLVVAVPTARGPRYRLLESVAAYARDRLHEAREGDTTAARHVRHHRALAEHAEPLLRGAGQRVWLARLDAESAELRAALDHALGGGDPREAVALATALSPWWLLRGRLHEGRRRLAETLAAVPAEDAGELRLLHGAFAMLTGGRVPEADRTGAEVSGAEVSEVGTPEASGPEASAPEAGGADLPGGLHRARALWMFAHGLHHAGDPEAAMRVNARALRAFTTAADPWGVAAARSLRAQTAFAAGDLAAARDDAAAAARAFAELGDSWGELQTVPVLAALAEIEGDYAAATERQSEGLRLAEELGLPAEVSARLAGLGRLALLAGEWERARVLHERARREAAEQGHMFGEVFALMGLALGARRSGDLDAAERHLRTMRDAYPSSAAGRHLIQVELGFAAELRGLAERAAAYQATGLALARRLADPRALALSFEGSAGAAAAAGGTTALTRAALLLGAADTARRDAGAPLPGGERADVDRIARAARTGLGEPLYAAAFREGAALSPAEAVRAAAGRDRSGRETGSAGPTLQE